MFFEDPEYPRLADYYSDRIFDEKRIEYTRQAWLKEVAAQFENLCGFNVYNAIIQNVTYTFPKTLVLHFRDYDLSLVSNSNIYFWDGESLSTLTHSDIVTIRDCFFEGIQSTDTPTGDHLRLMIKNKIKTFRIIVNDCQEAVLQKR